ncbi:MAG: hypothetical protein WC840_01630 [Candidatus Peribacteraceae bacterium]
MEEHVPEDIPDTRSGNADNDAEDKLLEKIGGLKQRHAELLHLCASAGDTTSIRGLVARSGKNRNTIMNHAAWLKDQGFVEIVREDYKSGIHIVVTDIGRRALEILEQSHELMDDDYGTRVVSAEKIKQAAQKARSLLRNLQIPPELQYVEDELRLRLLPTALDAFAEGRSQKTVLSLLEGRLAVFVKLVHSRNGAPRPSCAQFFGLDTSKEPPVDDDFYSRAVAQEESTVDPYWGELSEPENDDDEILDRDELGRPVYRAGCSPEELKAADLQGVQPSGSVDDLAEEPEETAFGPKISPELEALRVGQFRGPERILRDETVRAQAQALYDSARLSGKTHQGALTNARAYLELRYKENLINQLKFDEWQTKGNH